MRLRTTEGSKRERVRDRSGRQKLVNQAKETYKKQKRPVKTHKRLVSGRQKLVNQIKLVRSGRQRVQRERE